MKEEPKTKCSELGFQHSWRDVTPSIMYPTYPPRYPDKEDQCINCGLIRTHRTQTESWFEYTQGEVQKRASTANMNNLIIGSGSTTKN